MAMPENLKLLRRLLSEVRKISPDGCLRDSLVAKYILEQSRKYQTTGAQLCKARDEMTFLCQSYLCYLQSGRKYNEIVQHYKGKGERTVQETADMVGFKLPHDPK